jgi:hypothetical protein
LFQVYNCKCPHKGDNKDKNNNNNNNNNKQQQGMKSRGKIVSHLFYMDDMKLFSRDETKLQQKMNIVKMFSDII